MERTAHDSRDAWTLSDGHAGNVRQAVALAAALNAVLSDSARARAMGVAGRQRAVDHFAWPAIAARTVELYRSLL